MALPWDKLPRGMVGKGIDTAAHAIKLDAKFLRKPFIGKKASDLVTKVLPFKGVNIAATLAGALSGPLAPIVVPIVAVKRWRAAGQIHPLLRRIGSKK